MVQKAPKVRIGITSGTDFRVCFRGIFYFQNEKVEGKHTFSYQDKQILWNGKLFDKIKFEPTSEKTNLFELEDVKIGIDFHWEQKERQIFSGNLEIIVSNKKLVVINQVNVETYLGSVISSEMRASASLGLLKAHAVISRSWLLNKLQGKRVQKSTSFQSENEIIRWWENDDHYDFDVCADDHCQRYQGVGRITNELVRQAVHETQGEVLTYNDKICDTRFSKCCGGALEEFRYCWAEEQHPYLTRKFDAKNQVYHLNLQENEDAKKWIEGNPDCFCNTSDKDILSDVLNNYDFGTPFFRWKVTYKQTELSDLIHRKTSVDFGKIIDLIPIQRGTSARITKLKIVGTKQTLTIGKELFIRKVLSESHLYSSAFVVEKTNTKVYNIPSTFILKGAGWGHGVGLCQIGAAVMGERGYNYRDILAHYYPNTEIQKMY